MMVKGSGTLMVVVRVVHMYPAAATVPSMLPMRMKTIMETSYPANLILMFLMFAAYSHSIGLISGKLRFMMLESVHWVCFCARKGFIWKLA